MLKSFQSASREGVFHRNIAYGSDTNKLRDTDLSPMGIGGEGQEIIKGHRAFVFVGFYLK